MLNEAQQPLGLSELTRQVKNQAYGVITAQYPEWKQRNLSARASELLEKKLDQTLTTEEQTELDATKSVWGWVKSVRAESDRVEGLIETASSESELEGVTPNWPT